MDVDKHSSTDISEETKNTAIVTPVAIVNAVILTGIFGFFVNVSLCYGIRDLSALPGPTGLVFAQVGQSGTVVILYDDVP